MAELSRQSDELRERRSNKREIMILRAGLLEQDGKPFFCLVRNVSSTGIQAKLYGASARRGDVIVRVADEEPIAGRIVWIRNGNAGIAFDGGIDPTILLRLQQKLTPAKRRSMPRVKATSYGALLIDGRIIQAVLRDISSLGARVTTSRSLEVGALASIRLPNLPEMKAYVRWTECSNSGLVFETPIPMHIIGQWIDGQCATKPSRTPSS
jgi:PilZ domain